jgi:hypothetical protein
MFRAADPVAAIIHTGDEIRPIGTTSPSTERTADASTST